MELSVADMHLEDALNYFMHKESLEYGLYLYEIVKVPRNGVGQGFDLRCCDRFLRMPSRDGYVIDKLKKPKTIFLQRRLRPKYDEHEYLSKVLRRMIDIEFLKIKKSSVIKTVRGVWDTEFGLLSIYGGLLLLAVPPAIFTPTVAAIGGTLVIFYGLNGVVKGLTYLIKHRKFNGEEGVNALKWGVENGTRKVVDLYPFAKKTSDGKISKYVYCVVDGIGKFGFDLKNIPVALLDYSSSWLLKKITPKKQEVKIEHHRGIASAPLPRSLIKMMIKCELNKRRGVDVFTWDGGLNFNKF